MPIIILIFQNLLILFWKKKIFPIPIRLVPQKDYYKELDTENGQIIQEIQDMYNKVKKSKKRKIYHT